jgi:hypothetical protein
MNYTGGCLCGALRYSSSIKPIDVGYCHCRMCQRLSGATALPWASFATGSFNYTQGRPKIYASSDHGQREFCEKCGSQIAFRATDSEATVEINVGTFDDPEIVTPEYHIWCDSQVSWFDTVDGLPRYAESSETQT